MDRLSWDERFSVGIKELDGHHQRLAELINDLSDSLGRPLQSEAIVDILGALSDYAAYHFAREEKLLGQHQYPELETQVREHSLFCEVVADACYEATCRTLNLESLLNYLQAWWSDHILQNDLKYAAFLQARGVC